MPNTRTFGPLHFEDLDPKRFEDLVRQLIYDFKPWRRLEATGRSGSDDGFDARGYEMRVKKDLERVSATEDINDGEESADGEEVLLEGYNDRLWLIQCKREKAIGPTKLASYLGEIVLAPSEKLHGIVFSAACDFSKKARDRFAEKCRELGIEEWYLWGKAELEDQLLRPQNDHLLFAYFGFSLTIRRRSQRVDLRARLVMKRKANRLLKSSQNTYLLLRSPETPTYPHADDIRDPDTGEPPWHVRQYQQLNHDGLLFCVQRYFAYMHDDGKQWDAAMILNDVRAPNHEDYWREEGEDYQLRERIYQAWRAFPKANQAWLEVSAVIPFEDILDIDELGDEFFAAPHIYVPVVDSQGAPFKFWYGKLETAEMDSSKTVFLQGREEGRISMFPAEMRNEKLKL